jgi:Kef-type K+ transport system membrane component KefB
MTLTNAAVVSILAVTAPLLGRAFTRVAVPVIVLELLLGVVAGPRLLGWFEIDAAVSTLALLGVTFLFFLAGVEVNLATVRGELLGRSIAAYGFGLLIALASSWALRAVGLIQAPLLVGIAFSATGLGLVVPILRNAGLTSTDTGTRILAAASVAEFAAVILLALTFSVGGSALLSGMLLGSLALLASVVTLVGQRFRNSTTVTALIDGLSGGTVQLRVRLSVALVTCFAALAELAGLEVVLGAFFAGGILNVLDGGMANPKFQARLDGLGYGFLIPAFFIASGARLDLSALSLWPDALLLVPLLTVLLLLSRGAPVILMHLDGRNATFGAALLGATSLPFIVTAAQVGVTSGRLTPSTAAAMTTAGLIAVLLFPAIAVPLLHAGRGSRRGSSDAKRP